MYICMYEPQEPNCKNNNRMGKRSKEECMSSNESLRLKMNKGAWTSQEDEILKNYVSIHGDRKWSSVAQNAGLNRCGKSCRLRWLNYLKPGIKRGDISPDEEDLIIRLHRLLGNRWSLIARRLPGRTDNEIKNYWHTILAKKKLQQPEILSSSTARSSNLQKPNCIYRSSSLSSKEDEDHKTKEMATTNNSSNVALISRDFGHLDRFSEDDLMTWDVLNFDLLQMDVNKDHNDTCIIGSSSSSCNATLFQENELVMDSSSCGSVTTTSTTMGDDQFSIFHNELKKVVSFLELEDE